MQGMGSEGIAAHVFLLAWHFNAVFRLFRDPLSGSISYLFA